MHLQLDTSVLQVHHLVESETCNWQLPLLPQPSLSHGMRHLVSLIDMKSRTVTLSKDVHLQVVLLPLTSLMFHWVHTLTLWEVSMRTAGTPSLLEPSTLWDQHWRQSWVIHWLQVTLQHTYVRNFLIKRVLGAICMKKGGSGPLDTPPPLNLPLQIQPSIIIVLHIQNSGTL
jgi:hypothetical protein